MTTAQIAEVVSCMNAAGAFAAVQGNQISGFLQPYLKFQITVSQHSDLNSIGNTVEALWNQCSPFWTSALARQGLTVDYAAPGSSIPAGSGTTPTTNPQGGGPGILDQIGSALGLSGFDAAIVGGGLVLLLLVMSKR
jgi:hypothetical protein